MIRFVTILLLAAYLGVALAFPAQSAPLAGYIVGALGLTGTAATIVGSLISLVASTGLSLLAQALGPKQKQPGVQIEGTKAGEEVPQFAPFGRTATGGYLAYHNSHGTGGTPNEFYTMVMPVSALPGATLRGLIVNDKRTSLGETLHPQYGAPLMRFRQGGDDNGWIRFYDGTQTAADSDLVAAYGSDPDQPWTANHIGSGIAYAIITLRLNREVWQGVPKFRFILNSIPLYDPRKDSTAGGSGAHRWGQLDTYEPTENPIVIAYNIMRGFTLPDGDIYGSEDIEAGDLPLSNWIAGMNICDVDLGARARFTAGLLVSLDTEPSTVVEELLKACLGQISETGGVFRIRVAEPDEPVMAITAGDISITNPKSLMPFPGLEGTHNEIRINHPSAANLWEPVQTPVVRNSEWESADGGRRLARQVSLPACFNHGQAQAVGAALAADARCFTVTQFVLPPDAQKLEALDTIEITDLPNGFDEKLFEVVGVTYLPGTCFVAVTARERDPDDYAGVPGGELPPPPDLEPTPVDERIIVSADWAVVGEAIADGAGDPRRPALSITWTPGVVLDARALRYQVRVTDTDELVAQGRATPADGRVVVAEGILPATAYVTRLRPVLDRPNGWTGWKAATTPDVRLTLGDLDESINESIEQAIQEAQDALEAAEDVQEQLEMVVPTIEAIRDETEAYKLASEAAQTAAELALSGAETAETNAGGSATAAAGSASFAETKATEAGVSASSAAAQVLLATAQREGADNAASAANTSASSAAAEATAAGVSAAAANTARLAAETARGGSEIARNEAVTAREGAEDAANSATASLSLMSRMDPSNLLPNGGVEAGNFSLWVNTPAVFSVIEKGSRADNAVQNARSQWIIAMEQADSNRTAIAVNNIPCEEGDRFYAEFWLAGSGGSPDATVQIIMRWLDEDGDEISNTSRGFTRTSLSWAKSDLAEYGAPAGAVTVQVDVRRPGGGSGVAYVDNVRVEKRGEFTRQAQATASQAFSTATTNEAALANITTTVAAEYGDWGAFVTQTATAVADINGFAAAYAGITVETSGGNISGFRATSWDNPDGGGSVLQLLGDYVIVPGSLSVSRLIVADLTNLVLNDQLDDTVGWGVNSEVTGVDDAPSNMRSRRVFVIPDTITGNREVEWATNVDAGRSYLVGAEFRPTGGSGRQGSWRVSVSWQDRTGSTITISTGPTTTRIGSGSPIEESQAFLAPAGAVRGLFRWQRMNIAGESGNLHIGSPSVRVMGDGTLTVDGSLLSRHIDVIELLASTAFINNLTVTNAQILGNIQSDNYAESGGIPTAGFRLERNTGLVKGVGFIDRLGLLNGSVSDIERWVALGEQTRNNTDWAVAQTITLGALDGGDFWNIVGRTEFRSRAVNSDGSGGQISARFRIMRRLEVDGSWQSWENVHEDNSGATSSFITSNIYTEILAGVFTNVQYRFEWRSDAVFGQSGANFRRRFIGARRISR